MRAIDVMASHIVTATPQMTVQDAAKLMINNCISGLPIVETRSKPPPSAGPRAGVNGSRRIRGWPPITSSHARGGWPIS